MTDNNAAKPAETAAGEKKAGPIRQWIKDHPNIWEFILFNVLSNISTITRFVVTWIGTAIFISGLGLTQPFHFLIFNYDTKGNGLGGFLTFLLAEVLAQVVNFFVQMKWVFKSDSSFKDAAWKYVILAVIIVFIVVLWPIFDPSGTHVLWQWGWLKLTRENLVMAAVMGLRIPALGFACFLTLFTTSQTKLIRGLTSLGMPYKAGLTLATALRYIPVFFSIFQSVSAAQRARGLDLNGKKDATGKKRNVFVRLVDRFKSYLPIIIAVLIRAYKMSQSVGWAMESRGLNLQGVRRTYRIQLKMRLSDWIILAVTVAATAGSIWLMLWQF